MNHQQGDPVIQFCTGFGSVAILFAIEFSIFIFDTVNKFLPKITQTLPPSATTNQLLMNFSTFIGLFIIIGLAQNLIIGLFAPKPFVFGFLVGDGIILYALYIFVLNIIPSVVYGMVVSFLIVLGCLIIRLYLEKPPQYNQWEY